MTDWLLPFLCGLAAGTLSAWGVGGGTLLLLAMTLFLDVEQRTAQGINLLFFLPVAALSLFFHRKNGRIDSALWIRAALPGTLAALAAALIALAMDVSTLRKPFGVFLLWIGFSMLRSARKG